MAPKEPKVDTPTRISFSVQSSPQMQDEIIVAMEPEEPSTNGATPVIKNGIHHADTSNSVPDEAKRRLGLPDQLWSLAASIFDTLKTSKKLKTRSPQRKRDHYVACLLIILSKWAGVPRTFAEVCNAFDIRKQEIGSYYRIMMDVMKESDEHHRGYLVAGAGADFVNGEHRSDHSGYPLTNGNVNGTVLATTVDTHEGYIARWCETLEISRIVPMAFHVLRKVLEHNLLSGKCPTSVSAACIKKAILHEEAHGKKGFPDTIRVAQVAGIAPATLVGALKALESAAKDRNIWI